MMKQWVRNSKQMGAALERVRKQKNITQVALGRASSLRQATISKIEKGDLGINLSTLFKVLAQLNLELVIQPRTITPVDNGKNKL